MNAGGCYFGFCGAAAAAAAPGAAAPPGGAKIGRDIRISFGMVGTIPHNLLRAAVFASVCACSAALFCLYSSEYEYLVFALCAAFCAACRFSRATDTLFSFTFCAASRAACKFSRETAHPFCAFTLCAACKFAHPLCRFASIAFVRCSSVNKPAPASHQTTLCDQPR